MNQAKRKIVFVKNKSVQENEVALPVALKELPTVPVIKKEVVLPVVVEEVNVVVDIPAQPVEQVVPVAVEQTVEAVEVAEETEPVAKFVPPKGKKFKKDFEVGE